MRECALEAESERSWSGRREGEREVEGASPDMAILPKGRLDHAGLGGAIGKGERAIPPLAFCLWPRLLLVSAAI